MRKALLSVLFLVAVGAVMAALVAARAQDTVLDEHAYVPLLARDDPFGEPPPGSSFQIAFLDVGQGDAILLTVGDERMLIDAGRGAVTVERLEALDVTDLNAIVATHPDADHIGGFDDVLARYAVTRIFLNGGTSDSATFAGFISAIQDEGAFVRTLTRGDRIGLGGLAIDVIHPGDLSDDSNADSVVLSFTCGSVDMLFTGDATVESEESMLEAGLLGDVDVLKVGHHGSNTSTSQEFLDIVKPEYAIISAGRESQFGHPHETVVTRLESAGAQLIATDTTEDDDTLVLSSDCETFTFARAVTEEVVPTPTPTLAPVPMPTPTATPTVFPGVPGTVEITTVHYDPEVEKDIAGEYVLLTNAGVTPVQMGNWRIEDDSGVFYTFPAFVLDPAGSVAVHNCTGENGPTDRYTGVCQAVWNNDGDVASLYDAAGTLIDQYVYPVD